MKVAVNCHDTKLSLTMAGAAQKERVEIRGDYPENPFSHWLFSQFGLMYLVAPHFPRYIKTNFSVEPEIKNLISAMYKYENATVPKFISPELSRSLSPFPKTSIKRAVNSYSGGKDSLWNQAWMQEKYGVENILAVHIAGLNKAVAAGELRASEAQAKRLGFHHFRVIELKKSSSEKGANVLRAGKIFASGLLIPLALEFGAQNIVTEEPGGGSYFSGQHASLRMFNQVLRDQFGIPVKTIWRNRPKEGVVKDLILRQPDWLPHVHNCFTQLNYKIGIRESWLKRTPTFPPFESACGSCVKCRITRLGWLLYGNHHASDADAITFIRSCEPWREEKWATHKDLLVGSFALYLNRALKKYNLTPRQFDPSDFEGASNAVL